LFMIDCWRRSGTTSGAIHTAMPRTIVVLSWVYIITASSYEYKDGITTALVRRDLFLAWRDRSQKC